MATADWTFQAQTRATTTAPSLALASLTDLYERQVDLFINQPGAVTAKLDLFSPQASRNWLTPGVHELLALRADANGDNEAVETVFQLATAKILPDQLQGGVLDLSWLGILSYLSDNVVGPAYTSTGATDRVQWNVISTIQAKANADFGITDGTHTAGQPSKTLTVDSEKDGKAAINDVSERENGNDFRINVDRQFETWYPFRGTDKSETLVLQHEGNCFISEIPEDASPGSIVNYVKVKGGDSNFATAQSTASQLTYGRREAIVSYSETGLTSTILQQYANAIVAARARPTVVPTVVLDTSHESFIFGDAWLGDTIRLRGDIGAGPYITFDGDYRVVAVHIKLSDENDEEVSLELNPA